MEYKINYEELDIIVSLYYKEQLNLKEIAELYNVGHSTIERFLKRNNYVLKTSGTHKNGLSFNKEYFKEIDSSNKAYYLGLLYADGALFKDNYAVSLTLKDDDSYIIEEFKQELNYTGRVKHLNTKSEQHSNISYIQLYSKEFYYNCLAKGLKDRKSNCLLFPDNNILSDQYLYDFIRGYFDGDGCVHFIPDRGCLRVNIVGTFEFLTSLQNIFVDTLGFSKVKIVQKSINNNFSLQINRNEDIHCFYKKLYMNEKCLNLHRKKNIFDKWIITK